MNWNNARLIFFREVRDQLRDRRTLFMILVLPILLYPLLGMSFSQLAQFIREQPCTVLLVGHEQLPTSPALVVEEDGRLKFAERWFSTPERSRLLEVRLPGDRGNSESATTPGQIVVPPSGGEAASGPTISPPPKGGTTSKNSVDLESRARQLVQQGEYEAVIVFPDDFSQRLADVREQLARRRADGPMDLTDSSPVPSPKVLYNTAKEKSAVAFGRVSDMLHRWTEEVARENLAAGGVPEAAARPFNVATDDVAVATGQRGAALWAKILPFMLLVWALTGAFYPAVDLCAGEKERGTLETLLSSPAQRSEIVWGKLLTIMLFSIATAVLNLVSMGITGELILSQLPELGKPPKLAMIWLVAALIPVSALFSALCLALAAFARSTKEGQYYLMPLLMVTMPLVLLPMSPGFEMTPGNCLIPVTGVMLVLRAMLEGNVWQALPYIPIVSAVTLVGCLLAIRWAIDQFNTESVLFRESERLDLGLWLRHLMRDREDTPTVAAAVFCGMLILLVKFFMEMIMAGRAGQAGLEKVNFLTLALVTQIAVIATPALLMTVMFTRSPRKTLLLQRPPLLSIPAAVLLAVSLHPCVSVLQEAVQRLYPINDQLARQLTKLLDPANAPPLWQMLLVIAVAPAICEELAFRGFILSGLRHLGHKRRAILISSLLFGITHSIFQQSLISCLVGVIIGYMAVQTGSLLPGVLYHAVHNGLGVLVSRLDKGGVAAHPVLSQLFNTHDGTELVYYQHVIAIGGLIAVAILLWLRSLPYARSREEKLQEAIEQNMVHSAAS
jgi:sodium transport system permease protein